MRRFLLLGIAVLAAFVLGCPNPTTTTTTTTSHVFIAGSVGATESSKVPVYWKDGALNYLPLTPDFTGGQAAFIAVDSSGAVYVSGEQWGKTSVRGYWKGSTFIPLDLDAYTECWFHGLVVDSVGSVWITAIVGTSSPPTIPVYWKNFGKPIPLPDCTNVFGLAADASGNVYFTGTFGGSSVYASPVDYDWTPAYWKNEIGGLTGPTALPLSDTNTNGYASPVAVDASGNVYTCGWQWSSIAGEPVYWKNWSSPTQLPQGSYSSYNWWSVDSLAIGASGKLYFIGRIGETGPEYLVYWNGATSNPAILSAAGNAYWNVWGSAGAEDARGNFLVVGSVGSSSSNIIPVYWKNGGDYIQLPMGPGDSYGQATTIAAGPSRPIEPEVNPRAKYEGECSFCWVDGSEPDMPVWDDVKGGWVPQASDTREQIEWDQTFAVAPGTVVTVENKIVWVRPTARENIEIAGTLRIRNSLLIWEQTEHQQCRFEVQNGGILDIKDSYAFWGNQYWVNWDFQDGATVIYDHFVGDPWTAAWGRIDLTATNFSTIKLTFLSGVYDSDVQITNAHHVWLEIYPPEDSTIDTTFPEKRRWHDWNLNGIWPNTSVSIADSYIYERDISLPNGCKATVRDTPSGFSMGWAISYFGAGYIDAEIDDLGDPEKDGGVYYTDRTWSIPENGSSLRVVKSKLQRSWPVTFGKVHLVVRRSNLVDPRVFDGQATYEIYDSTIDHFAAYGGARSYLENCRIRYDIEAKDPGTVVYGYEVTSRDPGSPFQIMEIDGGDYQELATQGRPW
jgi:hypothetical protein